jgi:GNAT superfamily N-acetyltransferase
MNKVTESNQLLIAAWDGMSEGCPAYESRRGGLIDVTWMGYPCPFFNLAVTMQPPQSLAEFERAAQETAVWAQARQHAWLFAVCHETMGPLMPEVDGVLAALGLQPMMPMTGMEADQLTASAHARPAGVWLTESDPGVGDKAIRINEAAYQMSLGEPGSLAPEHDNWWVVPERMVTVLVGDGQPVSTSTIVNAGGTRYAALVATHPDAQRKGYAEAALRDVLERARSAGMPGRMYLHATAAGKPVYERMGFRKTAEYTVYLKH